MRREILNNQRPQFSFYGSKKQTGDLSEKERKLKRRDQLLSDIDQMQTEAWNEYDKLINKRSSEGYFLLSLQDKLTNLKNQIHPSWRYEVNK